MHSIYLDYCNTTPVAQSVRDAMLPFLTEFYGHPSSSHWFGRAAHEAIEDARSNVASLLACHPSEVIFTSGGTESVNLALLGLARAIQPSQIGKPLHLITTELEHAAVLRCAEYLQRSGWEVSYVGCDEQGQLDLEALQAAITDQTRIVSVIHANHRVGTVQPIADLADLCRKHDILLHTDAAQTFGKLNCNVDELGIDLLSLSGHKFYAPKGIGVLYVRTGVPMEPILFGEGNESGLRPGTPNVPFIVGLGQAAKLAQTGLQNSIVQSSKLRDRFQVLLEKAIGKPLRIHGSKVERIPTLLSFELPGVAAEALARKVPELSLGIPEDCSDWNGAGTRCNRTLAALGLNEQQSASTLRVSFGWNSSEAEVEQAADMIANAYESLVS